jgi:alpha-D-xyloside xylohydrolase
MGKKTEYDKNMTKATGQFEKLTPIDNWQSIANGIWKCELGDISKEQCYSNLAAEPPRLDRINALSPAGFPFVVDGPSYQNNDGKITVRIPAEADEQLYGFGLQFDDLQKNKTVLTLNTDHWDKGGGRTHAPVPFYISSRGYGVFFNTARFLKVYCQIGNRKDSPNNPAPVDRNPVPGTKSIGLWQAVPQGDAVEGHIIGKGMELIVFSGVSMLDVVRRYNLYCGGGTLPPLWGMGFWHRVHATFDADQTEAEVAAFNEKQFPLDVVGLEPGWMSSSYPCTFEWQKARFSDPAALAKRLLRQGVRLNLWINPYISPESRIHDEIYPYSGSHMVWLGLVPDYYMPQARQLLVEQHTEEHLNIGISGYKVDEVDGYDFWLWPDHATFPSGTSGESMRQTYGLLMQHLLYKDLFRKNNQRTYGNVRSSNGAASGYPFVIYSDSYDHAQYITGISAASLCGVLWTPEIRNAATAREWLNRMQTVCFSPMAKLNAWATGLQPWSFPEVEAAVRKVIQLRMRLLPYIYSAFADYHFNGVPPMRAMILESDANAINGIVVKGELGSETNPYAMDKVIEATDQFMFGPSIMVAPFYDDKATERQVHFPPGSWYDFYSGQPVGSHPTLVVKAEVLDDQIPLFVKDGALIPMLSKDVLNTEEILGCDLEVRHYGTADGTFELYEDDGKSFDYEQGSYRIRTLSVTAQGLTETLRKNDAAAMFGSVSLRSMI